MTTPRKPDRPAASLLFSSSGKVSRQVEHFPRTQRELELEICRKFCGALAEAGECQLSELVEGAEPADIVCRARDASLIHIQVSEVIDPVHLQRSLERRRYVQRLMEHLDAVRPAFVGCSVSILDDSTQVLPDVRTDSGKILFSRILDGLRDMAATIDTLPVGSRRNKRVQCVALELDAYLTVERFHARPSEAFSLDWQAYQIHWEAEEKQFLADAVRKKIGMNYSPPAEEFWLLLYTMDSAYLFLQENLTEAQAVLDSMPHPFAKVWLFQPLPHVNSGLLGQIWPQKSS